MVNIEDILTTSGAELTDEQRSAILDGVKANYRTIAEVEQKAEKIKQQAMETPKPLKRQTTESRNSKRRKKPAKKPMRTSKPARNSARNSQLA